MKNVPDELYLNNNGAEAPYCQSSSEYTLPSKI